ncbi:MAG: class I SAM-dependent methyltransferase [Thermoplasmata archaeon]
MRPEGGPPADEQYFVERPRSPHRVREFRFLYRGEMLRFETDRGLFASAGLDPGTDLLISVLDPAPTDRVLDMGCGWGPLGIAAARAAPSGRVLMVDVNRRAVHLARLNARENRLPHVEVRVGSLYGPVGEERFDIIVTNPPYHAGRPMVLALLEGAPDHLVPGGRILLVGKGSQGILFYQKWLEEKWGAGAVEVRARGSGYRVLEARPAAPPPP